MSVALQIQRFGRTFEGAEGIAPTLRLGFQPPYIAVFALEQQKLLGEVFGAQSPAVEFRRLLSLDPIVEALVGGSVDLGMGGTPLGAIAAGQPIKVVALVERSPKTHAVLVAPDSPIKRIADLKGKKIGTPSSQPSAFVARALRTPGCRSAISSWSRSKTMPERRRWRPARSTPGQPGIRSMPPPSSSKAPLRSSTAKSTSPTM